MYDTALQMVAAAAGGQLWRPILIFGVIAGLMVLIAVAQRTNPERRPPDEDPPQDGPPQEGPAKDDPPSRDPSR